MATSQNPGSFAAKCDQCGEMARVNDVQTFVVQTARQTHWSPAEYESRTVCGRCYRDDSRPTERDPDLEREEFS